MFILALTFRVVPLGLIFLSIVANLASVAEAGDFTIKIVRKLSTVEHQTGKDKDGKDVEGDLISGVIFVNDEEVGKTYENNVLKIPVNDIGYEGKIRVKSPDRHCLNDTGKLGTTGDFLVEIVVQGRSNILIHGGIKPWQSEGCVMLGAVVTTENGERLAPKELVKLRELYFSALKKDPGLKLVIRVLEE